MTLEGLADRIALQIPQPHCIVLTATDHPLTIRAKGHRSDITGMTRNVAKFHCPIGSLQHCRRYEAIST